MTPRTTVVLPALLPLLLGSCCMSGTCDTSGSGSAGAVVTVGAGPLDDEPGETELTLVYLKTGPMSGKLPAEENATAFQGHFANMGRMAGERQLLVAGPFGQVKHDPGLRGLFVMATGDEARAMEWASSDPTTRAGVFVLEPHALRTDAPLAEALERDLARLAEAEARGESPAPGEGARGYVLLVAEDHDRAVEELADLRGAEGGVFLLARLDGTRALALLDAATADEARERFGPSLEHVGPHVLDEWFASDSLAAMVE